MCRGQEGDVVRVLDRGEYFQAQGTIKRIHYSTLWLHGRNRHENAGIFVVRAKGVELQGGRPPVAPLVPAGNRVSHHPLWRLDMQGPR
jgi:hypothetical protein